jgi:hypothetical protein
LLDFSANKKNIKDYLIQSLRKIWPGIRRYFRKFLDNTIQILVVSIGVFLIDITRYYIYRTFSVSFEGRYWKNRLGSRRYRVGGQ